MEITNASPYFFLIGLFFLVASFFAKHDTFFKTVIVHNPGIRYQTLDGLRGLLALTVFLHHSVTNYFYFTTGSWTANSPFYSSLGSVSVLLFFMITGFLFWSKAISNKGKFSLKHFYISRFRRLAPMYYFSVLLVFLLAGVLSHFRLQTDFFQLFTQVCNWLMFGLFESPNFSFNNIVDPLRINAGVVWTLRYEWLFYFSLPFLVRFATLKLVLIPILFLAIISYLYLGAIEFGAMFISGIVAAHLRERYDFSKIFSKPSFSIISAGILLTLMLNILHFYFANHFILFALRHVLLFLFFLFIVCGNDFFGFLTSRGSKYLGAVSYSVYLLHGILLFISLNIIDHFIPINAISSISYWTIIGVCGLLMVFLSGYTYRYIEYPFLLKLKQ